ncbi:hypothetical protein ABH920_008326 [Catenulispora sp. EB89]|uniref:hypothetical protein n=1 Tax=Catenulispora sp. EB89 TaxID=3156257 RepID=UPI003511B30A
MLHLQAGKEGEEIAGTGKKMHELYLCTTGDDASPLAAARSTVKICTAQWLYSRALTCELYSNMGERLTLRST